MSHKLKWHGPEILGQIRAELRGRLESCCLLVVTEARRRLSPEATGVRTQTGSKNQDGPRKSQGSLVQGANPSQPGEALHRQRGQLPGSVASEVSGLTGRVGTNMLVGLWLELGTRRIKPRPWLQVALKDSEAKIKVILSRRINNS